VRGPRGITMVRGRKYFLVEWEDASCWAVRLKQNPISGKRLSKRHDMMGRGREKEV